MVFTFADRVLIFIAHCGYEATVRANLEHVHALELTVGLKRWRFGEDVVAFEDHRPVGARCQRACLVLVQCFGDRLFHPPIRVTQQTHKGRSRYSGNLNFSFVVNKL